MVTEPVNPRIKFLIFPFSFCEIFVWINSSKPEVGKISFGRIEKLFLVNIKFVKECNF